MSPLQYNEEGSYCSPRLIELSSQTKNNRISLPPPNNNTRTNIWANTKQEQNNNNNNNNNNMLQRRFSHIQQTPPSPIGSPISITHDHSNIHPIPLSTDRYRGSLSSPLSSSFGPNSLPNNLYQPWYHTSIPNTTTNTDSLMPATHEERTGRSKARDILGAPQHHPSSSYRDPSVGSIGSPCSSSARSGIGLSNMSPFTGTSLLPPGTPFSFRGSLSSNHNCHNLNYDHRNNRPRDSSLGAIGSGRMSSRSSIPFSSNSNSTTTNVAPISSGLGLASSGSRMLNKGSSDYGPFVGSIGTDSWLTGGYRSLNNDLDEDDEFAQPTKSGATSRRHSVSAFTTGTNRSIVLQGFEPSRPTSALISDDNNKRNHRPSHESNTSPSTTSSLDHPTQNEQQYEHLLAHNNNNNSAITDEDLCFTADLNSLNLDLETQTKHAGESNDHLGFQFSNHYHHHLSNHLTSQQTSPFQLKPFHAPDNQHNNSPTHPHIMPAFNNVSWASPSVSQALALPAGTSISSPFVGQQQQQQHGHHFARKSSFSAGDPFSASAQASRYFASQAGGDHHAIPDSQPPVGSRFPFSHSALQPLGSLSTPSVTTFSASGLLSAPSPHSRQPQPLMINGDTSSNKQGAAAMGYYFEPSFSSYYPVSPSSHAHLSSATSPLSPIFHIPSSSSSSGQPPPPPLMGSSTPSHFNTQPMTAANKLGVSSSSSSSSTGAGPGPHELSELGKGIPLHQMPRDWRLYIVEFKGGRTDLFYHADKEGDGATTGVAESIQQGDLVIVEADRGKDLGKVVHDHISIDEVSKFQARQLDLLLAQSSASSSSHPGPAVPALASASSSSSAAAAAAAVSSAPPPPQPAIPDSHATPANISRLAKEIHPKKIFGKASAADVQSLHQKMEEERKALSLCRSKALQRGLKMEITAAEWQWDRRKLTFFFIADKRIDFRDLVKDLFRTWKTRIWMCSVNS
ncbi:hypothetical protein PCANC_15650 [Puccinia coronata f. sp. avenae]|uniref:PSP1 C-terminal domain-containing protein n=1 Tax=Puccinia coronata f. sp. avenae TaxID=200324 RepID=A0A2N5UPK2_9BASI|nr:hypothetical protein PCANC_15650 [Puccinia coronata f. sp. avenae]